MKEPWKGRSLPFCIWGNLYFVGTAPASTHLIDTGDGLIVIDPGYPQQLYLLIDGIYRLGFSPDDIKIILISHGHYDHFGAARALQELCGAKTYISAIDAPLADGTLDLTLANELGCVYHEFFTPDVLLQDGDTVTLGNTEIRCLLTPGHSDGTLSFFFDAADGAVRKRCGMFGGAGFGTLTGKSIVRYGRTTQCRRDYIASTERLLQEDVDIFLGNHVHNNDTLGKFARMQAGESNPFLHTNDEWKAFLTNCRAYVLQKYPDLDAL